MKQMEIKIIKTGCMPRDRIIFEVDRAITQEEAYEIQKEAGYNPAGYGFESFIVTEKKTTWLCWTSCD